MREEKINSVNEFHDMSLSYYSSHPIFRGVNNSSYDLTSRIGRSIIKNKDTREHVAGYSYVVNKGAEIHSLERFKKLAIPYLNHVPPNDWEWLALAQHHGLPTRLMDWTSNPLVAAFFACNNFGSGDDAAIYAIDNEYAHDHVSLNDSPFEITSVSIFRPHHTTTRITAQSGLFTVHSTPEVSLDNNDLCKWVISHDCILDIEIMINSYGVNHASMFPGLDGIARLITRDCAL